MGLVVLSINKPDLPESLGWKHEATDWKLAEDPKGKNVIVESKADKRHLTSIVFDVDLDPNKTYYGFARVITNKTIFEATVSIIKAKDYTKVVQRYDIPSMVAKPFIYLDFPYDNFPSTLFTIKTNEISTSGNAKHLFTSWIIETSDGKPVFVLPKDRNDLTSKFMDNIILKEGRVYIIKVAHGASSGDVSEFATQPIYIKPIPEIVIKTPEENPDVEDGLALTIKPIENLKKTTFKLFRTGIGDAELFWQKKVNGTSAIVPLEDLLKANTNSFILGVDIEYKNGEKNGTKYQPIIFTKGSIPYKLGIQNY